MTSADQELAPCIYGDPSTPVPAVQLLSNGSYHVMVTSAGGGYSRWKNLALTRWRDDATCDDQGAFCYIRDIESGRYWSTTYQPTLQRPGVYEANIQRRPCSVSPRRRRYRDVH